MDNKPYDKLRASGVNAPTAKMKFRTNVVIQIAMMLFACAIIINLFKVSVVQNKKYEALANNYHFGTMRLEAQRGAIYDATGTPLAWSATVYNVYIDPQLFRDEMDDVQKNNESKQAAADKNGKTATDIVDVATLRENIATYLAGKLNLEKADIEKAFDADGRYYILQTQVEKSVADEIDNYFDNLNLVSFATEATTKRYYPQEELAASVIGFTNGDGDGQYGLEYQYNDYLAGVDGRIISAQAANGEEMPYRYSTTYEAENGASLYLTLDTTLQYYLEKAISEMSVEFNVQQRACGIIMNPKTGAIYAMATYPSFDLNQPSVIYDTTVAKKLDSLTGQEYSDAYQEARETQWKNKAISEIHFPGSVFKVVTTAAAMEEKLIDLQNDSFYCNGSFTVMGETIGCSNRNGHGAQSFTKALTNSCNPAFMEIGLRLGTSKFSYYFKGFGLTEKTGIDLPGEANSLYISEDVMSNVDLASSSFGQANKVTPIQTITAYAAAINGGKLVTPYLVEQIVDADGNIVMEHQTEEKRQVVSEATSQTVREQLEAVVENNPTHNAYIEGYRIGGKSGTAEKLDEYDGVEMKYAASYGCFAPADDPEVIMLIIADEPDNIINYYGSAVVTPYAKTVMSEILPYLGFYPEYTDEEYADRNVTVPLVQEKSLDSATATLDDMGLSYEVVGEGSSVVSQCPKTGAVIEKGGKVILYTEENTEPEVVEVPNLVGLSAAEANTALTQLGLNIVTMGASSDNADAKVQFQSEPAGTSVEVGTVINLTMSINDQSG
ncbi:MAG TPA: peptidoglycan glycosyltransferase [Ruminococcus sp.]|nr:peptidoglycan glycosyltransferase [Ruminococcus sp.]HCW12912.1 peptidoglycan glycosyltransferase [Ruminococcus sp.]